MAILTLHPDSQAFPPGTKLKVYPITEPAPPPTTKGQPPGTEVGEFEVVSAGTLTVTGLTEGKSYVGWAATPDRYLRMSVEVAAAGGGGGAPTGPAGGDLEGTYPNPEVGATKVTAAKLAANAVENAKIKNEAVTTGKLAAALKAEVEAGGAPSGAAGGDLEGSYPNPTVKAEAITAAKLAAALKAELGTSYVMRTVSVPAGQVPGNELLAEWKIKLRGTEKRTIVAARVRTSSGTIKVAIKRGATGTTEIAAYKELAGAETEQIVETEQALSDGDRITVTGSAGATPKGLFLDVWEKVER